MVSKVAYSQNSFDFAVQSDLSLPDFPDEENVIFSKESGFFENPFELKLQVPSSDYKILYTVDCSNPQELSLSAAKDEQVTLKIEPDDTLRIAKTPVYTVRASLVKEGYAPSRPVTKSYIFLNEVKKQGYPGGEWPESNINGQVIDLGVATDIIQDSRYTENFDESMLQIPSIAISTDIENIFDSNIGIYVNAKEHGKEWERECAIEFIYPDSLKSYLVHAGLRIRGGNSRNDGNPKHAFRLFFREEYGNAKLRHFVFGNEGVGEFDKLDLRTAQNYSWSMDGSSHNTFLRDIFSRDLQRDMNAPYTRGNFVHLYLNGMYWGLFQTEERPEARFAESYFGDDKEDYDVIKVAVENWPYVNEATDGDMDAWEELWDLSKKGFRTNLKYFALEGKDENGISVKNSRILVDIDNLIDYMLVIFYTANVDAPVSAWYHNAMPNNYYAIYNRKDKGKGFIFLVHDSEHSMFVDPIYVHDGLYENRVEIDDPEMVVANVGAFQPQWLHYKLTQNEEYRLRFADRTWMHLNASLSTDSCKLRLQKRADEIDMAIIAESARWGDAKTSSSRNKLDHWIPEVESITKEYIPYRTDILIDQLVDAGLFTYLEPPKVYLEGAENSVDFIHTKMNSQLELSNPNNIGSIYYTLDGSDPRMVGGMANPGAKVENEDIKIPVTGSKLIIARIYDEGEWSAKTMVKLAFEPEDYSNLKVSEIHYHPKDIVVDSDTIDGKDLEFLELKNVGSNAIDLSRIRIDSAINYQVPENTLLPPGGFYVVASKPETFYGLYGQYPDGNYRGHFSNSGERVVIIDPHDNLLCSFLYDDKSPWPESADGEGYSLVSYYTNADGDPADPLYWRSSYRIDGSPYDDDMITSLDEYYTHEFNWDEVYIYPNPTTDIVTIQVLNRTDTERVKISITDIMGRVILDTDLYNSQNFSLKENNLQPGVFFVNISVGNYQKTYKIVYQP